MKFGQNLPRNQVPEWAAEYINYKGLKKLIKSAGRQEEQDPDLAEFFYSLDRNLEHVDNFYNKRYSESSRRLKLLNSRYGQDIELNRLEDRAEIEDIIGALLEVRSQLRKLQWYGEVNRRGFIKITKKLDKKVQAASHQQQYLANKVDPKHFATNKWVTRDLNNLNAWLLKLGDIKPTDDASSTHSSISASRTIVRLPKEMFDDIDRAIKRDDLTALQISLLDAQEFEKDSSSAFQRLLLNLLQRAIATHSRQCIRFILSKCPTLLEEDDMNERSCLHRLVISIGRSRSSQEDTDGSVAVSLNQSNTITPAEAPNMQAASYAVKEHDKSHLLEDTDPAVQTLVFLLDSLSDAQQSIIVAKDTFGRIPLHYAAQYGFVMLCEILIARMKTWSLFDLSKPVDSEHWVDIDGYTPLHLAVIGGHHLTTKAILDAFRRDGSERHQKLLTGSSSLLYMATAANFVKIVCLLMEAGADPDCRNEQGEAPLHSAARFGNVECAKAILNNSFYQSVNLNVPEAAFEWTPLVIACVDGQLPMVEFLVNAGANIHYRDSSGWTAMEHAALRGHMPIVKYLAQNASPTPPGSLTSQSSGSDQSSLEDRKSNGIGKDSSSGNAKPSKLVKSFGHRYLQDEAMVLVSLGSTDNRKVVKPVSLDSIPINEAHATQLDTALSLVISASGASGESEIIDLPVQDNISTEPIAFTTKDISKVKLMFDIVPTYSGSKDNVVGRGVALLSSVKTTIGPKKMNLQGDITVPIIAAKTLEYIGSVHFNFIVVTPFKHPKMMISETQTYWKSITEPMVIGHRGLGKNTNSRKSLQLGENTIQSFIAAANLGASYVEFDVQLTKDHVPIIYHDFLVSETGIDAPVHSLTLEQFLHINKLKSPGTSRPSSPHPANKDLPVRPQHRERSNSLGSRMSNIDMSERMRHTRDFKAKGFKGNSLGNSIQAPFTTLEEMFRKLPENIGFNIEMKYPMLYETEDAEMDTYAVELNSFVDTVLQKVYDLANKRDVIFSSFSPDICLLLSLKQPSIPILFLTDAGSSPVGDIRASSLQEAVRFASRWNLLGIVSAATPLVACPRLVRAVKESGLVCVSYGVENNDTKNVDLQIKEGIDAVIVDNVLAIRKGLTYAAESEKEQAAKGAAAVIS